MKFPSLQSLWLSLRDVNKRFPFEIAFALLGTVAATVNIELSGLQVQASNWCVRFIMAADLGLVLSLSAILFSESRNFNIPRKYALRILAALLALAFLFLLNPLGRETDYLRFFMLALGFHLLVAFAAFIGKGHINAFWQFNKTLFLRFLTGILYSAVLYLGLAAAIGSMNLLFNFQFEWDTFAILWIWIVGLFQTVFFLSGVPEDINALEGDRSYPKGLKIFTQYVLIPLATVYVVILLAYEIKILIEWDLPKGLVSNLILGYAVFGILSLLLIYPVRNLEENKWVKTYSRSFYFLLIPLIVLLVGAVAVRVKDYGVTEQRYFLIVLAVWLSFLSGYFLLSKRQDIRIIPISLCLVILFSVYGPQGAFSVARQSQLNQLKQLFSKYGAIENNKIIPLTKKVDSLDEKRMVNVIDYLVNRHGLRSLNEITAIDTEKIKAYYSNKVKTDTLNYSLSYYNHQIKQDTKDSILRVLNINRKTEYGIEGNKVAYFKIIEDKVTDVTGYRRLIEFNSIHNEEDTDITFGISGKNYVVITDPFTRIIIKEGKASVNFDAELVLKSLLSQKSRFKLNRSNSNLQVPDSLMTFTKNLNGTTVTCRFNQVNGGYRKEKQKDLYVLYFNGIILIK